MHPVFAAKACDPDGDYVRQWLPQLRNLPREFIHCPWEAPATMLAAAGVSLGRQYPKRILIDLEAARRNSLAVRYVVVSATRSALFCWLCAVSLSSLADQHFFVAGGGRHASEARRQVRTQPSHRPRPRLASPRLLRPRPPLAAVSPSQASVERLPRAVPSDIVHESLTRERPVPLAHQRHRERRGQ